MLNAPSSSLHHQQQIVRKLLWNDNQIDPSSDAISALVFIDSTVEHAQVLVDGLDRNTAVFLVDNRSDGIDQITRQLHHYPQATSIHIVSHGAPGCIYLGHTPLSLDTLSSYRDALKSWGKHDIVNTASGNASLQILFYGCNVAAGDAGAEFIDILHHLTGASISASAHRTGHGLLGGNWDLEVTKGDRLPILAFSEEAIAHYPGILATFTVTNTNDSGDGSLRQAILDANALAGADSILFDTALTGSTITLTSGGLEITEDLIIDGLGADLLTILSTSGNTAVFSVNDGDVLNSINVSIDDLTITNNGISTEGGGVYNRETLMLSNVTIADSTAYYGGGIYNAGILTLADSSVTSNTAYYSGGGIYQQGGILTVLNSAIASNTANNTVDNNFVDYQAGGIHIQNGDVTITGSSISNNRDLDNAVAFTPPGGVFSYDTSRAASGILNVSGTVNLSSSTVDANFSGEYSVSAISNRGTFNIDNTTISNNVNGYGVLNAGTLDVTSSTIAFNEDASAILPVGQTTMSNSILLGNGTSNSFLGEGDLWGLTGGSLVSEGYNLIGYFNLSVDGEAGFTSDPTDIIGYNPDAINPYSILEPLQDNGGGTLTHALVDGSIAVDGGDPNAVASTFDQRGEGFDRLVGDRIDIGAVELQNPVPPANTSPVATDDVITIGSHAVVPIYVLANDFDADGDPLYVSIDPSSGSLGYDEVGPDGTYLTYIARYNRSTYTDILTYQVSDGKGGTDTGTVTINVVEPLTDDAVETTQGTPVEIDLFANDYVFDTPWFYFYLGQPSHGTLIWDENGTTINPFGAYDNTAFLDDLFTYIPDPSFTGVDSFIYSVNTDLGYGDTATVNINVTPSAVVNTAPIAVDDSATTDEDSAVTIAVLANDTDAEDDPLSVTTVSNGASGTVAINADGTLTYTPDADFFGSDSFTYTISDGTAEDTATVAVTVDPVNDAPVATADRVTIDEDTVGVLAIAALLSNDSDLDGDVLTLTDVSNAVNGSVSLDGSGNVIFTPAADFFGEASFDYSITDGRGGTSTTTIAVTVNPAADNTAPIAMDDIAVTDEDVAVTVDVLANDSDPDGNVLTLSLLTTTSNGTVTLQNNGTLSDTTDDFFTYTPKAGFFGSDRFTYQVTDPQGATATATVNVIVQEAGKTVIGTRGNDVLLGGDGDDIIEGRSGNDTIDGKGGNDQLYGQRGADQFVLRSGDGSDRIYGFNPSSREQDSFLLDGITFEQLAFSRIGTDTVIAIAQTGEQLAILVNTGFTPTAANFAPLTPPSEPINTPPVALNDTAVTNEDQAVTINVLANDSDLNGDALTLSLLSVASNGVVTLDNNGTPDNTADDFFTYVPNAGFFGSDSFTYRIADGAGGTATATVGITVNEVITNTPPIAGNDTATTDKDVAVTINVLANDSDPDGDALTLSLLSVASNGVVTLENNGTPTNTADDVFTYTPNANFFGSDSFTYQVADAFGETATATVSITVIDVAEPEPLGAVFTVTNTNDSGAGSLRQAILDANAALGENAIAFDPSLSGSTITLTSGGLAITDDLIINGLGSDLLAITLSGVFDTALTIDDLNALNAVNVTISGLTIANSDLGTTGSGIANQEALALTDVVIANNTSDYGGGIYNAGNLTLTDSAVAGNTSLYHVGGLHHKDGDLTIINSQIDGNITGIFSDDYSDYNIAAAPKAGGIYLESGTAEIVGSNISNNVVETGFAGGIYVQSATAEIIESSINDNSISYAVGEVPDAPEGAYATGGISNGYFGTVNIINSAIYRNISNTDFNSIGAITNAGAFNLENSTVSSNTALGSAIADFNSLNVSSSTIAFNNSPYGFTQYHSSYYNSYIGVTTVKNSIIFDLVVRNSYRGMGRFDSQGYNLIGYAPDSSSAGLFYPYPYDPSDVQFLAPGDIVGEASGVILASDILGPLQDNGGPTLTHALVSGSIAVNGGNPNTTASEFDQRGFDRVVSDRIDIGSFELQDVSAPVDNPPIANDDVTTVVQGNFVDIPVLINDSDPDGDSLRVSPIAKLIYELPYYYVSGGGYYYGTAETFDNGTPDDSTDDVIRYYTTDFSYSSDGYSWGYTDIVSYQVSDGRGGLDKGTITVNVLPATTKDMATTNEDTAVDIDILGNDAITNDSLQSISNLGIPSNGTVALNTNGTPDNPNDDSVTYTPNVGFSGVDHFSYQVSNINGFEYTENVEITVEQVSVPVNNSPIAVDDSISTDEDVPITVDVLANDSDPDSNALSLSLLTGPSNGSITQSGDRFVYTPNPGFFGSDSFIYQIADGLGGTDTATVAITVNEVIAPIDEPIPDEDMTIIGSGGNDILVGGSGNDLIEGRSGNDIIDGGRGNDELYGQRGTDKFVLRPGDGIDLIYGYNPGQREFDSFLLDGLTFEALAFSSTGNGTVISIAQTGEQLAVLVNTNFIPTANYFADLGN